LRADGLRPVAFGVDGLAFGFAFRGFGVYGATRSTVTGIGPFTSSGCGFCDSWGWDEPR
jgi:hypothetical protein